MRYITIALAKGRLAEITIDLLEKAGLCVDEIREKYGKTSIQPASMISTNLVRDNFS